MLEVFLLWVVFTVMPNISALFGIAFTFLLTGICIGGFIYLLGGNDEIKNAIEIAKPFKTYIQVIVIGFALTVLIPSTAQMKTIIGGYFAVNTIQAVGNVEGIEQLPANVVKAMNRFLEEKVDE